MAADTGRGASPSRPHPTSTYRLQFNAGFGFRDAARLAPYLARLGVGHVYASPYLMARPGSTHGYDVVDHGRLNPEVGSDEDFEAMVAAFASEGLGQVLDIVPNHMGVGAENPFWWSVLEWGARSDHSAWFDIDWEADSPHLRGRVLAPVLGDQYGRVLAAGEIALEFDASAGSFHVSAYGEHRLPIDPNDYGLVLASGHPALDDLGDAFAHLDAAHPHQRRRAEDLKRSLAALVARDADAARGVADAVAGFAGVPGDPGSWRRLHDLIERQHWRLAHFRVASDDINYRRFFNVNELAGLRMENPDTFAHVHGLVFELVARGVLDGLRVDHVDGLLDPKAYCLALRAAAPRPVWLVVEKILSADERLRPDWDTDGTTGYEAARLLTGVLVDGRGEGRLTEAWRSFTGETRSFAELVREAKLAIMDDEMASELSVLARDAARIAATNPLTADFTRHGLHRALREVVAAFPVYRTYVDRDGASESDRRIIDRAFAAARRRAARIDPSVFDFLHGLVTGDAVARPLSGYSRHEVIRFAMRVQQYSGPVMAKGLEDTAFYRFNRLIAVNEVGGDPGRVGVDAAEFHEANRRRLRETPHAMVSTSTHDTKRGEDARARLAVLASMPDAWSAAVGEWSRLLRGAPPAPGEAEAPSRADEYLFYQMLLGSFPADLDPGKDPMGLAEFAGRIRAAAVKSMREAKVRTTWVAPDEAYEAAALGFLDRALDPRACGFLDAFVPFARRVAALGLRNGLVQTALKLTVPGVPDVYRGAELLDLSMVDPDNRRPVDFAQRAELLSEVEDVPVEALAGRTDGAQKLALTARLLRLRRRLPGLFSEGGYEPMPFDDARLLGFVRRHADLALAVVVLRYPEGADDTAEVRLPDAPSEWTDVLGEGTGEGRGTLGASLPVMVRLAGGSAGDAG